MMTPSTMMTAVPIGIPVFLARIWETMSVPPVLPPLLKTRPSPAPVMTPPQRAQRSRSLSPTLTGRKGTSASVRTPHAMIPATVRTM